MCWYLWLGLLSLAIEIKILLLCEELGWRWKVNCTFFLHNSSLFTYMRDKLLREFVGSTINMNGQKHPKESEQYKGKIWANWCYPPIYISIYIPHMWFTNLTQCKVSTELPSCILTPFNPFKDSWIILMEQISSSTTILVQNPLWNNRFHFSIFFCVKSTWNNHFHFSIDFGANWNNHFHFSISCSANPLKT